MVARLPHAWHAPPKRRSVEIIADPQHAGFRGHHAEPRGGIVFAAHTSAITALGAEIGKRGRMPEPRGGRENPQDFRVVLAGRWAPALQQHFLHGLHAEEIAFQREGAAAAGTEAHSRLVLIHMEAVSREVSLLEDLQVPQGRLAVADAAVEAAHPRPGIAAPLEMRRVVPLRPGQGGLDCAGGRFRFPRR